VKGPNGAVDVKVEDVGDGTFHAVYDTLPSGDYTIDAMIDTQPVAKFLAKKNMAGIEGQGDNPDDDKSTRESIEYTTVYSSGTGIYSSGNDGSPDQFSGFQGSPPLTADRTKEKLIALRSVLRNNDFEKLQLPDTEEVLFLSTFGTL